MAESQLPFDNLPSRLFVVMGVAGCGKSSIGEAMASRVGGTYLEGDQYHPANNIEKMSRGEPLTDEDRWPWLEVVAREMAATEGIVFAGCSALKRRYRDFLKQVAGEPVTFIYLDGSKALIASRMEARTGHFMPVSLLNSQFASLEIPVADEGAIALKIDKSINEIVEDFFLSLKKLDANS